MRTEDVLEMQAVIKIISEYRLGFKAMREAVSSDDKDQVLSNKETPACNVERRHWQVAGKTSKMGDSGDLMSPELQCSQGVDGRINPPLHIFQQPARSRRRFQGVGVGTTRLESVFQPPASVLPCLIIYRKAHVIATLTALLLLLRGEENSHH